MNIAVLGYYGFGNVGDEVILDNLRRFLAPHTVVPIPLGLNNTAHTVRRLNTFDFVILGGGGLYRREPPSPFAAFDRWGHGLRVRTGALGLGVSQLAPQFVDATHSLIERSEFFQVRDEESQRILGHPKVELAPDLTFFRPLAPAPQRRREGQPLCGVNLRPAQPGAQQWVAAVQHLGCRTLALPFSVHPTLGDREALLALDPACPSQIDFNTFRSIDVLIGTAFHSIVFAVQMGIPTVAINYDAKVERFMREVGLSDYLLGWDEPHKLRAAYESALACHEPIRQQMLAYRAAAEERLQAALAGPRQVIERQALVAIPAVPQKRPLASLIVCDRDVPLAEKERTLASCLDQTYEALEIVLVCAEQQVEPLRALIRRLDVDERIRLVPLGNGETEPAAGLAAIRGEYVAWMEVGGWLALDAVAVLVTALEDNRKPAAAQPAYYATRDGIIERKVYLDSRQKPGRASRQGPFLLARRNRAAEVWRQAQRGSQGTPGMSLYVQNALFYCPSSVAESDLYRALVAFGRGDAAAGERLLGEAVAAGWDGKWLASGDVVEFMASVARSAPPASTPEAFVEMVFSKLPATASGLSSLKRKVLAQVAMRRFFDRYGGASRRERAQTLVTAVANDPAWLANRGVWAAALRLWRSRV
jgi:hypothetical protein